MSKSEPLMFVCKTGSITVRSRVALKEAGVIVVEVEHPADCSFTRGGNVPISGNQLASAAVEALSSRAWADGTGTITSLGRANEHFVKLVAAMLKAQKP